MGWFYPRPRPSKDKSCTKKKRFYSLDEVLQWQEKHDPNNRLGHYICLYCYCRHLFTKRKKKAQEDGRE